MGRRVKATEGQWGHPWASTECPELYPPGQEESTGLSDHCLLPPALHASSGMLAAGLSCPHLSPLSSSSPTSLPSLTCCLWHPDTVSMSYPSFIDTHSQPMALTPWALSFSTSPATHTLLGWFSPKCTPRTFLEFPILFSHFPIPFLPLFLILTQPSLANESPTLALAWWHWPKPGASVPTDP